MTFDTLHKWHKLFAALVAAVVATLLVVALFVAHVLHESQLRYYANAEETSKNLAIALENFLHSHFQEVDLAMRRAAQEFQSQHQQQRFDDAQFSAFLRSLKERLPQAQAVRGSDRDGRVIYGEDIDLDHPQDLTIREFFQRAKTERDLIFGVPVVSRISGQRVLPLVYAMTLPDGSFGGTAYVNMNNARIAELFSSLNIGEHGAITLLDSQKRILHRYPEAPDLPIGSPVQVSDATAALLAGGRQRATYSVVSMRDGMERVLSLEKIGAYPVYVLVGLSSADFLAPWHKEVRNAALFLAVLVTLASIMLLGVRFALRKQHQSVQKLIDADSALHQSWSALSESESRWRSLTEGLPQMVWTATPQRHIDFLSHHWQEFGGVPADWLPTGGDWSGIVHPDDRAGIEAAWQRAVADGQQFRCDARLRRHDGVWRVFDHHGLPQKDADGVIVGWVGSSTDITEARAAHDALLQAKEAALGAGRAKSEFVANMSHEIRSPMNAVLGMLQLLQQTRMDARQLDYAVKAEAAARALLGLLNDILDFSKVEAGKLALDPHPFSLDKLWRDLSVILSANVGDKPVEVLFRIDPSLPAWVVGDALRLQQVLLNLAGNAVKFTERGEVVLSATLVEHDGVNLAVAFSIRDTGIGIPPEQHQAIFDGFSQAEASTARRYGGSGLGLAISQRLVHLMGGTLRVDSAPGRGSEFGFTIVLQPGQPPAPAVPADSAGAALRHLHCLVVDDNLSARVVLGEMAASFGWQVEAVENGYDALAAVARREAEQPYDVVLIDWRMPELDGWSTSCQIRQLAPAGKTPLIIMVTAHDRAALAQQHASLDAVLDGVLVKPVTASMLFDAVADARLGRRAPPADMLPAGMPAPSLRRLAGLRLLLVDDSAVNRQVAGELLGHDGAQVSLADGGQAAIAAVSGHDPLPDLILMDIQMPDIDGYAATAAIRALLGERAPPIVAMTANAMPADRAAALAAGMVDHVGKPFELAQLIGVILFHTGRAGPAGLAPAAPGAAAVPDSVPGLNSAAALRRLGGLTQVYLLALRSFVIEANQLGAQLRQAAAGLQGASALAALHTLKGLAGTVGAEQLAQLAEQAELALRIDVVSGWDLAAAALAAIPSTLAAAETLAAQLDAAVAPDNVAPGRLSG